MVVGSRRVESDRVVVFFLLPLFFFPLFFLAAMMVVFASCGCGGVYDVRYKAVSNKFILFIR